MTGSPSDPDDPNVTSRYDPPGPEAPAAPSEPAPQSEPAPPSEPFPPPEPVRASPWAPAPRAATSWRSRRDDPGRIGTIVFGVILVVVGLWFFADQTLGLDMPRLRWSELWPVLIIGLGAWIVLGSMRRGS